MALRREAMRTDPELLAALQRARTLPPMTADERFEQAVSFVYGQMPVESGVSKEQVRAQLVAQR